MPLIRIRPTALRGVRYWPTGSSQPLLGWLCALGWCVATSVFIGLVAFLGGPALNDTYQSAFSTWAIAHGQLACAFPANLPGDRPLVSNPLWGYCGSQSLWGALFPFPLTWPRASHRGTVFPCDQLVVGEVWRARGHLQGRVPRLGRSHVRNSCISPVSVVVDEPDGDLLLCFSGRSFRLAGCASRRRSTLKISSPWASD